MDTLISDTIEAHHSLQERLDLARGAHPGTDPDHPRDHYPAIDTFLAAASRHNAAVVQVLVPAARKHLPDGPARARAYVDGSRQFEAALNQIKGKLYGSAYSVHTPWSRLWTAVQAEFEGLWAIELSLASDLAEVDIPVDWSQKLYDAESNAPSRPHPHIPHQGAAGTVARAVARRVDSFWDAAEGRMVPQPASTRDRQSEGPIVQYLLGDPHLDDALVEHVEEQVVEEQQAVAEEQSGRHRAEKESDGVDTDLR